MTYFQPYINYRLSQGFRAQEMDSHRLTHAQKVKLGLEGEYVSIPYVN